LFSFFHFLLVFISWVDAFEPRSFLDNEDKLSMLTSIFQYTKKTDSSHSD